MTRSLALLIALQATGCAALRPESADPLPPELASAAPVALRVEGVVMDRFGYAVPDAWVTIRVGSPQTNVQGDARCEGATHLPTRTRSSPMGQFATVVEAGRREPFLACLEIEALPPARLGLRENTTVVPSAAFTQAGAGGGGEAVAVRIILY